MNFTEGDKVFSGQLKNQFHVIYTVCTENHKPPINLTTVSALFESSYQVDTD